MNLSVLGSLGSAAGIMMLGVEESVKSVYGVYAAKVPNIIGVENTVDFVHLDGKFPTLARGDDFEV